MNYAIFRSEPIYTLQDLAQIGSHNKREKNAYKTNPNIKLELSKDNIELKPLAEKYVKGFYNITEEYRKEHDMRMKNERSERRRTFNQMLNKSKNVVADELLFTATHEFFDNMTRKDIKEWANTCMEFVYEDLGYTKKQVLHATVHLDEETPHLHCVVVPLVKKLDKRCNKERYTISKKQYIKDKIHLSQLQDKYHTRLTEKGYDLERGIKGSNAKHQKIKELKKTTRYYEEKAKVINKNIDDAMKDFEEKMKTTKNTLIDKEYVKIRKDTLDSLLKVIEVTKQAGDFQPKLDQLFTEINGYTQSHQTLEKENQRLKKGIISLNDRNEELEKTNNSLKELIKVILKVIKDFFRELLQIGNEPTKEITAENVKNFYDSETFSMNDVKDIAKGTTKEDELFDYAKVPSYYKSNKSHHKNKDNFDLSR